MRITKHAVVRGQQRGINSHQIRLIKAFGEATRVPGNAVAYQLTNKNLKELEFILKQGVQFLDKLKNKKIICDNSSNTVITCYHQ